jgi:hypothetical protein
LALAPIFGNAERHSDTQSQKAKARKERGDPPGKKTDPIGDELTWEQILCRFIGKTKLWIVTRDSDYGCMYGEKGAEKGFLNRLLYDELQTISPGAEAFLFENVADAIEHFACVTGVKADELPTLEQREAIKREEEMPPQRDFTHTDAAIEAHRRSQLFTQGWGYYLDPAQGGGGVFVNPGVIDNPPIEPQE